MTCYEQKIKKKYFKLFKSTSKKLRIMKVAYSDEKRILIIDHLNKKKLESTFQIIQANILNKETKMEYLRITKVAYSDERNVYCLLEQKTRVNISILKRGKNDKTMFFIQLIIILYFKM